MTHESVPVLREKWEALSPWLDERVRRRWAGAEARALGRGGISRISEATGLSRTTIRAGLAELEEKKTDARIRRAGAGRKPLTEHDPELVDALDRLVEPVTRGDPESPLRWTCLSRDNLARALNAQGHDVSATTVGRLLKQMGFSLQSMRKTTEGTQHPDRDRQFRLINEQSENFLGCGLPVISVDTKKKELVGDFTKSGREWRPAGTPERGLIHDFPQDALGTAIPYGVYDVGRNEGWVSVGVDHDTAAFAVDSIRQWWQSMGSKAYKSAEELLITADAGGSNGYRVRAWRHRLQSFADDTGLSVSVSHFPPGTSKWNKIEHRLFSQITQNWRGRPLVSHEAVVNLIGGTTTHAGLSVRARLNRRAYPLRERVTDEQMDALDIGLDKFHGEWNYTLFPRKQKRRARRD
jgi:DNA-binding phage protein